LAFCEKVLSSDLAYTLMFQSKGTDRTLSLSSWTLEGERERERDRQTDRQTDRSEERERRRRRREREREGEEEEKK
jgi:hypothetical protein